MEIFLVTYDLNSPGQDYDSLFKALQGFDWSYKICDSTWIIKTLILTQGDIFDKLVSCIDANDTLFIAKISSYHGVNIPLDAAEALTN